MNTNVGFNKDFIDRLKLIEIFYQMGAASGLLLGSKAGLGILLERRMLEGNSGKIIYDFSILSKLLENEEEAKKYLPQFNVYLSRTLIISLYECFKGDNIRYEKVKGENWFNFLWILRNCFAHGIEAIWHNLQTDLVYIRKFDKEKIIIKKEWNGTYITLHQIGSWLTFVDLLQVAIEESEKFSTRN